MSDMSSMASTIDRLMGELEKLKEEVKTTATGGCPVVSESEQIQTLTNEVLRLQNENARLMETIETLKLQLDFFNDEEKVDHLVPCQQVNVLFSLKF